MLSAEPFTAPVRSEDPMRVSRDWRFVVLAAAGIVASPSVRAETPGEVEVLAKGGYEPRPAPFKFNFNLPPRPAAAPQPAPQFRWNPPVIQVPDLGRRLQETTEDARERRRQNQQSRFQADEQAANAAQDAKERRRQNQQLRAQAEEEAGRAAEEAKERRRQNQQLRFQADEQAGNAAQEARERRRQNQAQAENQRFDNAFGAWGRQNQPRQKPERDEQSDRLRQLLAQWQPKGGGLTFGEVNSNGKGADLMVETLGNSAAAREEEQELYVSKGGLESPKPRLYATAKGNVVAFDGIVVSCAAPYNPILAHWCSGTPAPLPPGGTMLTDADKTQEMLKRKSVKFDGTDPCAKAVLAYWSLRDAIAFRRALTARPGLADMEKHFAAAQAKVAFAQHDLIGHLGQGEGQCDVQAPMPSGGLYIVLDKEIAGVDPFQRIGNDALLVSDRLVKAGQDTALPKDAQLGLYEMSAAPEEPTSKGGLEPEIPKADQDRLKLMEGWLPASVGIQMLRGTLTQVRGEKALGESGVAAASDLEEMARTLEAADKQAVRFFFASDAHLTPPIVETASR